MLYTYVALSFVTCASHWSHLLQFPEHCLGYPDCAAFLSQRETMDAATGQPPFLEVNQGFYGKEVANWMQRAEPVDKARLLRVFEDLQKITDKLHPPPDAAALAELAHIKAAVTRKHCSKGKPPTPPKIGDGTGGDAWTGARDARGMPPSPLGKC